MGFSRWLSWLIAKLGLTGLSGRMFGARPRPKEVIEYPVWLQEPMRENIRRANELAALRDRDILRK